MYRIIKIALIIVLVVIAYWTLYYYAFLDGEYKSNNEVIKFYKIGDVRIMERAGKRYTLNNFNGIYCDIMENRHSVGSLYVIPVYMKLTLYDRSVILTR